jgi:hypothetical protein
MALATNGAAKSRARYVLDDSRTLTLNADIGERVGVGVRAGDPDDTYLIHQVGVNQIAVPEYAVGSAIAGGKVFTAADIAGAFAATGKLDALAKAVKAAQESIAKQAGGA